MPGLCKLYDGPRLLRKKAMDFQTHLYRFGEMEQLLAQIDFSKQIARRRKRRDASV